MLNIIKMLFNCHVIISSASEAKGPKIFEIENKEERNLLGIYRDTTMMDIFNIDVKLVVET